MKIESQNSTSIETRQFWESCPNLSAHVVNVKVLPHPPCGWSYILDGAGLAQDSLFGGLPGHSLLYGIPFAKYVLVFQCNRNRWIAWYNVSLDCMVNGSSPVRHTRYPYHSSNPRFILGRRGMLISNPNG